MPPSRTWPRFFHRHVKLFYCGLFFFNYPEFALGKELNIIRCRTHELLMIFRPEKTTVFNFTHNHNLGFLIRHPRQRVLSLPKTKATAKRGVLYMPQQPCRFPTTFFCSSQGGSGLKLFQWPSQGPDEELSRRPHVQIPLS